MKLDPKEAELRLRRYFMAPPTEKNESAVKHAADTLEHAAVVQDRINELRKIWAEIPKRSTEDQSEETRQLDKWITDMARAVTRL